MKVAILAALCMVAQDVLSVLMVQAEARNRGWLSGWLDAVAWLFGIGTLAISVTALQGHDTREKVLVVVFVSAANILGSWAGVKIGKRYIRTVA